MKKVNFDALKKISASEDLIARTLAAAREADAALLADALPAHAAARPLSFRRRLAVAAGFILVIGVSISAYFYIRNISNIPAPVAPVTEATDAPSAAPSDASTDAPTYPPTLPSQGGTAPVSVEPTLPVQPTFPTDHAAATPTEPPTVAPTAIPPSASTEQGADVPQPPIEQPTHATWVEPSEYLPEPTESDWDPPFELPTEAATDEHGLETPGIPEPIFCRGRFPIEMLDDGEKVYCSLFDSSGIRIGGWDAYAPERLAEITYRTDRLITVNYQVPDGIVTKYDLYTVVFYNERGETLWTATRYLYEN